MFTNFAIVGKVTHKPTISSRKERDEKQCVIEVEVERSYPEKDGVYRKDTLEVLVWRGIQKEIAMCCDCGSVVGIKGRIEKESDTVQLVAEHIRILQNNLMM